MEMDPGKLFIGGISWDTNEERLRDYFQTFGHVIEAVIMKDRTTGRARGFGFVVFADPMVAERVVKDKHIIDGRTVEAKKAVPRDDQVVNRGNGSFHGSPGPIRTKKIFVGGLASTVTESDFKNYFDQFGSTTDAVVMYDHNTQRPRGFGFITYESEESVDIVLHKTFHELNGKMVEVKRAVPKESSPGPNRSNIGGYNSGLSRVSSYLSSLGGYGLTVDGRYSPVMGRNGLGPSSYNIAPGSELGTNYGGNGNYSSNLGYTRSVNSLYSLTPTRLPGAIGYGNTNGGSDGNSSVFSSRDIWGNSSNYGFGAIWGSPNSGGSFSFNGGGNGVNATMYGRNSGNGTAAAASFSVADDDGRSFYADPPWRSSSPDLDIPGLFDYAFGGSDGVQKKSVGYVGYSVANRSNTGIAA